MFVETVLLLVFFAFAFTVFEFWRAPSGWQDSDGFHAGLPGMGFYGSSVRPDAPQRVMAYEDGCRVTLVNLLQTGRSYAHDL